LLLRFLLAGAVLPLFVEIDKIPDREGDLVNLTKARQYAEVLYYL
jgi:hypothetical protein